jgi:hypothetical protein
MKSEQFRIRPEFIRILLIVLTVFFIALLISGIMARKYITAKRQELRDNLNPVQVVVAGKDIQPDEPISKDMITTRFIPKKYVHGNSIYPEESELLLGKELWVAVRTGEPIHWKDFKRSKSQRGYSSEINQDTTISDPNEVKSEGLKESYFSEHKTVFVTKGLYGGKLGGIIGADAICQAEAAEGGLLTGTYKAWLSDSIKSPSTRFTRSQVPYKLVEGSIVATDWDDLTDGRIKHSINITATGDLMTNRVVWTNTNYDGTPLNRSADPSEDSCNQWSSEEAGKLGTLGSCQKTDDKWTWTKRGVSCNSPSLLYCFEQ